MTLTTCKDCGKEISTKAPACPHCGAPVLTAAGGAAKVMGRIWLVVKLAVAAVFALFVFRCSQMTLGKGPPGLETAAATPLTRSTVCSPADFSVTEPRFSQRQHSRLIQFTASVRNNGAKACGVQLKIVTFDKAGVALNSDDFWPASIRNIQAGATEHFTYHVEARPGIKNYQLSPISARAW